MAEQAAAICQELFAARGEHETTAGAAEQLEAEFLFEATDLARKRGLRDVQHVRRFRDGAMLGDGDEGFQASEVHAGYHERVDLRRVIARPFALQPTPRVAC